MGVVLVLEIRSPGALRTAFGARVPPSAPWTLAASGPGEWASILAELDALGLRPAEVHLRERPGPGWELRLSPGLCHLTAGALVLRQGRVLLLHHRAKELWLPPGGHVEPGEDPEETAVREVWEEAGLEVRLAAGPPFDLQRVPVEAAHQHVDLVFLAWPTGGRAVPGREADALRWFAAEELGEPGVPANVAAAARRALAAGLAHADGDARPD